MESRPTSLTVRRSDHFTDYLRVTSFAMALIRGIECRMLGELHYERPVLDLGCGDGLFASMLFDGKIDHGLDVSASEIEMAKASGMYRHLEVARAGSMPYPDNYFSTVYSNCVIEHFDDLHDSFKEVCRVLKPGGKFYCTTHSDHYREYFLYSRIFNKLGLKRLAGYYSGFWMKLWRHYNCLPGEEWTARLEQAGFSKAIATPYFPRRAVYAFDLALPLAAHSYILRKMIGRWKLFPRIVTLHAARWLMGKVVKDEREGDWCYLLVAQK